MNHGNTRSNIKILYALCLKNKHEQIYAELFSKDVENIEPPHDQGLASVDGLEAIFFKTVFLMHELKKCIADI